MNAIAALVSAVPDPRARASCIPAFQYSSAASSRSADSRASTAQKYVNPSAVCSCRSCPASQRPLGELDRLVGCADGARVAPVGERTQQHSLRGRSARKPGGDLLGLPAAALRQVVVRHPEDRKVALQAQAPLALALGAGRDRLLQHP